MKDSKKLLAVVATVALVAGALLGASLGGSSSGGETLGGSVYNRVIEFSEGITVDRNTVIDGDGNWDSAVTVGDGDAEDTKVVFDGNAQDYYCGLDDSDDDLVCGLGDTVGTTPAWAVDENQDMTVSNDLTVSATATFSGGLDFDSAAGNVDESAVTQNVNLGKFSDSADINAGADRAEITLTNSKINTSSFLLFTVCSTPDSGASLVVSATSSAGSAAVQVSNEGAANQTSNWSVCYLVAD